MSFLFRNPNFFRLWIGQVFSQSGGRMYQIAMVWWILSVVPEGSGKAVGLFMVMTALPSLFFVKKIGSILDRVPAKRILVTSDILAALTVGVMGFLLLEHVLPLPFVFAAGFIAATLQGFIDPTLNKSVAEVVMPSDVESGVALLASTQSLANFAGAVAGAMLIGHFGIGGTALLAAGGYLISSTASALTHFAYAKPAAPVGAHAASGWAVLAAHPFLKKVLLGFGLVNFFSVPTLVVLPLYTKLTLAGSATVLGSLEACLWIGLLGGTFLSRFVNGESRIRLGAICLATFGVCLAIPGAIVDIGVYRVSLLSAGAALGVNNVKFLALFQEVVAPEMKGRFFALMQALIGFTFPIGYFAFGALTDYISPPTVCLLQGAGIVLLALFFLRLAKEESAMATTEVVPCP